jgi:hypothetical protein
MAGFAIVVWAVMSSASELFMVSVSTFEQQLR